MGLPQKKRRRDYIEFDLWKYFISSLDFISYIYLYHIYNITCVFTLKFQFQAYPLTIFK